MSDHLEEHRAEAFKDIEDLEAENKNLRKELSETLTLLGKARDDAGRFETELAEAKADIERLKKTSFDKLFEIMDSRRAWKADAVRLADALEMIESMESHHLNMEDHKFVAKEALAAHSKLMEGK